MTNNLEEMKQKTKATAVEALEACGYDVSLTKINSNDKTKGIVGNGIDEANKGKGFDIGEALVLEKSETGKGFAIYADTKNLDKSRFKRLTR